MAYLYLRGRIWWAKLRGGRRVSLETADRAEAGVRVRKLERAAWEGRLIPSAKGGTEQEPSSPTLAVAYRTALRTHRGWLQSRSPETIEGLYRATVKHFGDHIAVHRLDAAAVNEWLAQLHEQGAAPSSLNSRLSFVQVVRKVAGLPALDIDRFRPRPGRRRVYSTEEISAFIGWFVRNGQQDMAELTLLLADTGCRLSEILHLTGASILSLEKPAGRALPGGNGASSYPPSLAPEIAPGSRQNTGILAVSGHVYGGGYVIRLSAADPKTGEPRLVPLTRRCCQVLVRRAQARGLVLGRDSGPLFPASLTRQRSAELWRAARDALGLSGDAEAVMHVLRHTAVTQLVRLGGTARAQLWAGHSNQGTTQGYTHLAMVQDLLPLVQKLEESVPLAVPLSGPLTEPPLTSAQASLPSEWAEVSPANEGEERADASDGVADGTRTHDNRNHNPRPLEGQQAGVPQDVPQFETRNDEDDDIQ